MDKHMIIDNRYIHIAESVWKDTFSIIPSVTCSVLSAPVSAHPDMALFKTEEKEFICSPDVFSDYEKTLKKYDVKLICGEKKLSCNYPEDIAYNVLKTDKFAFGKFTETDSKIIKYLENKKIDKINIKQGYAKCSVCNFYGGIISSDAGICKAALGVGLDFLQIPQGEIKLPGYDYGFIGGASGLNSNGDVFFFGDLSSVSYGNLIYDFLKKKNIKIHEIKNFPLTDVGTVMFF